MFALRAEIVTIFGSKMVTISARKYTNIYKICKLRKAIFSVFYNISQPNFEILLILISSSLLPWIPEPSTVNNKLNVAKALVQRGDSLIKPRQSQNRISGFSTDSVLKPLILFCDWRGLIKESPR